MFSRISFIAALVIFGAAITAFSLAKPVPKLQPISSPNVQIERFSQQDFATAVQCTASSVDSIKYRMDGWVSGNELYKSYIDPAHQCANPYPYKISSVALFMYLAAGSSMNVSVDIELVDGSNASCTAPGNVLAVSQEYTYTQNTSGYRAIFVPLDTPVTVNGPFFAGFYISTAVPTADTAAILLDNIPTHCQSYNLWDTALGFVDLTNFPSSFPSNYDFPGRVAMEVAGTPGGSAGNACCQVSPVTVTDFGTVNYPQTKDLQFTVTNCGTTTLNATASETCPAFTLPSGGGSFAVAPGQSHTTTVRFIPPTTGSYSCTVSLGNVACSTITFTGLSGTPVPAPGAAWLMPASGATLLGRAPLWIRDTTGSQLVDYAVFEYSNGGAFTEIGRDYDGTSPLRDGVNSVDEGNGYGMDWNFNGLPEGNYTLRATLHDTQGRTSSVTIPVYLEPTPPTPVITLPLDGSDVCSPFNVFMDCHDANMKQIQLFRHDGQSGYASGLQTIDQHSLGNANSNPNDGNYALNGEFGDYYSGPAAAALLVQLWNDRGYPQIMQNSGASMTISAAAESLATLFNTRVAKGTTDEKLFSGLVKYSAARGNAFNFDIARDPDFFTLRTWVEDEQRGVLLGLSGAPGFWVAVSGFSGWQQVDGNYLVVVSDPLTGGSSVCEFSYSPQLAMLNIDGSWHQVDIAISMTPKNWSVTRVLVGNDTHGKDGWSISYDPSALTEGNLYFFKAVGLDSTGIQGSSTVLTRFTCATNYAKGDFDGNKATDLADLTILLDFVINHRNPPVGGSWRADCNCDQNVNMADVVYYINYLFGQGSLPCH